MTPVAETSRPVLPPFQAGPKSQAMHQEEMGLIAPGLQSIALFSGLAMERGEGRRLYDVDGNSYLDFAAGIGVASIGHAHPRYVKAMHDQISRVSVGSFTNENRLSFLRTFAKLAPHGLNRVQLYSGGSEAVEAAVRMAKSHTGHYELLSFWGGFHGKTGGVMGLLGDDFKKNLGPLAPGTYVSPYPNPYRCPFKAEGPHDCAAHTLEFLREKLYRETTGKLAMIFIEPIQGTAGNVIPPAGWLKGLSQIAKENGALLLCDEMITGFGRTGKLFGFMHEDVVPDVLTIGKGVAAGFPVAGLVSTDKIASAKPFANPSGSSSSYGGNPMASAACRVTLDILLEEKLIENSAKVGAFMLEKLKAMQQRFPFMGDVRGRGLMIGIDLVKDAKTKEPLAKNVTRALFDACLRRGLICMCYGPVIRINPPLNITQAEAEEGLAKLQEAFAEIAAAYGLPGKA